MQPSSAQPQTEPLNSLFNDRRIKMQKQLIALGLVTAAFAAGAADVGVSVSVSQPGVYGRIDIGRFPQPEVIVAQPVVIQRPHVVVAQPQPVYMRVPPGHQKNWAKHCHKYSACGQPVYFVKETWYQQHVMAPQHSGGKHDKHPGKGKGKHGKHGD
jgi:hypothetical protein